MTDTRRKIRKPTKRERQKKFLENYEAVFGNITLACELTDISRMTYYRWIRSETASDKKFQDHLLAVEPEERRVDYVESKLMQRINAGDTTAMIFFLKCKAKHRGYIDRIEVAGVSDAPMLVKVLKNVDVEKV